MQETDVLFFEEYKSVDRILSDMFGSANGVSSYIEETYKIPYARYRLIPDWSSAVSDLRRLRSIRNRIAHDASGSVPFSSEEDLGKLERFHDDILKGNDPIARLYQAENAKKEEEKRRIKQQNENLRQRVSEKTTPVTRNISSPAAPIEPKEDNDQKDTPVLYRIAVALLLVLIFATLAVLIKLLMLARQ